MDKICLIHNEPALFYEQNDQLKIVFLCRICIQQQLNIQNIDDFQKKQKQALQQLELKYDQKIKQLKDFSDQLQQYISKIQQKLNKIKLQVDQNISLIIKQEQYVKNISSDFTNLQLNLIIEQESILNNQLIKIKKEFNNQLKDLEMGIKIDKLFFSLNNLLIDFKKELVQDENQKKIAMIEKKFNYQLLQQSTYKQNEFCGAIAFNKDATMMVSGSNKLIKVFEFKNDKLKEVQLLNEHQNSVLCLQFMRKSNQFITGSGDSTMIIWQYNNNNSWQSIQVLKGHSSTIYCIEINQNEDMLISGSGDNSIKFWQKINNTWNSNQSIDCKSWVLSLSLSINEDKLIASVSNNQILVIQLQAQSWIIKQKIPVRFLGSRLCFINSFQFVFQPNNGNSLLIFNYNSKESKFQIGQELDYYITGSDAYYLFPPIRYIPQIGLIMLKHYDYIYLIRRSQNGQFLVEQSIKFDAIQLFGDISDDGRYLATWDSKSNEIKLRKFEY